MILRNPFYSVLSLVAHLIALAVLFLLLNAEFLAAAQVVVYAGAVMVLYLFVVAYIGGATSRSARGRRPRRSGRCSPRRSASSSASPSSPAGSRRSTRGAPTSARLRQPGAIGQLLLTRFLVAVRGGLLPAADRGGGRDRARPPAARARGGGPVGPPRDTPPDRDARGARLPPMDIILVPRPVGVHLRDRRRRRAHRRNPLVVLLCLELMLNAGNLALIAFSRMHGSEAGQSSR